MEQILVDFCKIEVEYFQNIKETLKFINRFQKLCNNGDPVAQIPEELSENSDILDQTFRDYKDIFEFNKKLSKLLDKQITIDAFSLASFFQQNSSEFKTKYSFYCFFHLKHLVTLIGNNKTYFHNLCHKAGKSLDFGNELLRPQKMMSKYFTTFSELSILAKESGEKDLEWMFADCRDIISSVNNIIDDFSKADSIQGCNGNIRKEGYLLKSGEVKFIKKTKTIRNFKLKRADTFSTSITKLKPGIADKDKDAGVGYLFLFEGSLILCKKRKPENLYESVQVFCNFNLAVRILRDYKLELENVETKEKALILLGNNQEMLCWHQTISKFLQKYCLLLEKFNSEH